MSATEEDPADIIERATGYIDEMGFSNYLRNVGIGGVFQAFVEQIITVIMTAGGVMFRPLTAFGAGLEGLVDATFGNMADLIDAGFETAIGSFLEGTAQWLGISAPIFAVIVAMLTVGAFMFFVSRIGLNPWAFVTNLRN